MKCSLTMSGFGRFVFEPPFNVCGNVFTGYLSFHFGNDVRSWKSLFIKRFRPSEDKRVYIASGLSYEAILIDATSNIENNSKELTRLCSRYMIELDKRQKLRFKARDRK